MNNDTVWHAIVAYTYQLEMGFCHKRDYDEDVENLYMKVHFEKKDDGNMELDVRPIKTEIDLSCLLYTHWTLRDSMVHTPYVYGRMRLWEEQKGKFSQVLVYSIVKVMLVFNLSHNLVSYESLFASNVALSSLDLCSI